MENLGYLVAAYAVVWLGVVLYVAWIGLRMSGLRRDVAALRRALDEDDSPAR
jgi:CcmD family protein